MIKHLLVASALLLPAWSAAAAQDGDDLRIRVGIGGQLRPKFVGSDKTEFAPLWDVDIAKGANEFAFEAPDYSFGIPVVSSGGFSFGPAANIASSRKDKDVGVPLGKVKTTIEVGGFANYEITKSIYFHGELLKGLGGHDGLVGTIGLDQVWRDADKYVFSVGPRVLFSDSRYQRAYFGVTPEASLATGLPEYRPSGGIHGVAMASGLSYQFTPKWGMFGYARYERLVGDAARSPVVRLLGSRNQWSAGAGINYTFAVAR